MDRFNSDLNALFSVDNELLNGIVNIQCSRAEIEEAGRLKVITKLSRPFLYFNPNLELSNSPPDELSILLKYLNDYIPMTLAGGLAFYPQAAFCLEQTSAGLSLTMQEDRNWAPGEAINLFNHSKIPIEDFSRLIAPLVEKRVSSFTYGRIYDSRGFSGYTVLRRHFKE